MVVLETAQAVKFAETIQEALGLEAPRPVDLQGIEALPQRVEIIDPDVKAVKAIIQSHC
jgi:threonine synthase